MWLGSKPGTISVWPVVNPERAAAVPFLHICGTRSDVRLTPNSRTHAALRLAAVNGTHLQAPGGVKPLSPY